MASGTEAAVFPGASGLAAQMRQGTVETVCTVVESMPHASLFLEDKMIPDFLRDRGTVSVQGSADCLKRLLLTKHLLYCDSFVQ